MGMFDWVHYQCPWCGETIEDQSKEGPCYLNHYDLDNAPPAIKADMAEHSFNECTHCKKPFYVTCQAMVSVQKGTKPSYEED